MDKLLSVIIPTYNMEAFLPRCLESLLTSPLADRLEAMVVNDGSRDGSLRVAQSFARQHPDSVTVIDKPNGNYGSTINAALPVARGKYVKVLDADDWFDTTALTQLLACLESTDSDMVVTVFTQLGADGYREVVRYNTMGREPYQYGRLYALDDVLKDGYIRFFLMHALTYRTELLRRSGYRQTEGISYTDTEWASYPVYHAETIVLLDLNVYQYNIGRAGQTMDPAVLLKSLPQLEAVTDHLLAYHAAMVEKDLSPTRREFMRQYLENRIRILYKLYLLDLPRADFRPADVERLDVKYGPLCQQFGLRPVLWPENKLLRIDYIAYWHRHHRRWPQWLERANHALDVVVKWLYVKFIRR